MKVERILLAIFFGWVLLKGTLGLLAGNSADQFVLEAADTGWLIWPLLVCPLVASALVLLFVWRPSTLKFKIAVTGQILDLIASAVGTVIGLANPGALKDAFIAKLQDRGRPIDVDALAVLDSPIVQALPFIISLVFTGLCIWLMQRVLADSEHAYQTSPSPPPWP